MVSSAARPAFGAWSATTNSETSGDTELLEQVSHVAAACAVHRGHFSRHAPAYDCGSLDAPRDLAKVFDTTEYAKWKSFRQSEDARYVALCLPRVLGRLPGKDTKPIEAFNYEERRRQRHSKYLWMNAAFTWLPE